VYNEGDDMVLCVVTSDKVQEITLVMEDQVIVMTKEIAQGCALALDHAVARLEETQFSIEYDQQQRELLDREGTD
jgi:hypothetical protein